MKRSIALFSALLILFTMLCPLFSYAESAPDTSAAAVSYIYCFNTDKVLYSKNANVSRAPGSSAKMMSALIALEKIDDFDKKIAVTSELLSGHSGAGAGFKAGMSATLAEIFAAMVCAGSNDAAVILANYVAGDVTSFVDMMNKKAKELFMTHTLYANPTGVDDPSAKTTAEDIALLAFELFGSARFMEAAKAPSQMIACLGKRIYNRNYFRTTWYSTKYYNTLVSGMNAGVTDASGYCVTASADIGGNTYLCIVLGASDDGENIHSFAIARDLLNWASGNFEYKEVFSAAKIFCSIPVKYGNETDSVLVLPKRASLVYLPKDADVESGVKVNWGVREDYLSAPVTEGEVIGIAEVYYNGELVDSVELITGASVARSKTSYFLTLARKFFSSRYLWEIVIALAVLAVVITVYRVYKIKGKDFFLIRKKIDGDQDDEEDDDQDEDIIDDMNEDALYEKEKTTFSSFIKKLKNKNKKGE